MARRCLKWRNLYWCIFWWHGWARVKVNEGLPRDCWQGSGGWVVQTFVEIPSFIVLFTIYCILFDSALSHAKVIWRGLNASWKKNICIHSLSLVYNPFSAIFPISTRDPPSCYARLSNGISVEGRSWNGSSVVSARLCTQQHLMRLRKPKYAPVEKLHSV